MKTRIKSIIGVILALVLVLCLFSCNGSSEDIDTGDDTETKSLWDSATYTESTELGEGAKTVKVEVKAENKTVTFTIKTVADTVGDAMLEQSLLAGEESEFGLYVKTVNGITADYDVDKSYWAFYIDGEYAMTGVDGTEISEGAIYQLVYTK